MIIETSRQFNIAMMELKAFCDRLITEKDELRSSLDALLEAAKRVVDTQDDASRRDGDARLAIEKLQAAIRAAEEPAP